MAGDDGAATHLAAAPAERTCVGFAVDEAYALPMAVAGRSLIDHYAGPAPLEIMVLDLGITAPTRARVLASWPPGTRVRFVPLPRENLDGLPLSDHEFVLHLNRNVYGRWFLPELLPPAYRRLVYLDADILVLRDPSPLWRIDLEGQPFAAAQDKGIPYVSSELGVPDYREMGLPARTKYFNAGVMVIDLDRWRTARIRERALHYARSHPDMRFADQEALNAVSGGAWTEFPREWNCPVEEELLAAHHQADPRIIHFLGPDKPWVTDVTWAPHCQAAYTACLRRTAWATELPA
ncbi:glycosyltransferase family 8 protein [Streptomyces sp. NPDC126499]|uniref:glycosyltransferase family 8 protein n=1 Tax=Streptomyces sp. NPDC126499 TaxID=3155314 RepID=UPI0033208933